VAAKTANARRDALNEGTYRDALNEGTYRAKLIESGIGQDEASMIAAAARRFHGAPEATAPKHPRPNSGSFVSIGAAIGARAAIGASMPPAVKQAAKRVEQAQEEVVQAKKAHAPRAAVLTAQEHKLMNMATDIAMTPPSGEDMAFTHAVFCQVGLPRTKVEGREFMRQSGAAWVNVQAGYLDEGKGPVQQPIPYGVMPRLALAWVSTYAVRHGAREIPIGDSAAEFLRLMLGADTVSQGARYTTLRKQMHALAACRLQLGFRGRTFNGQPHVQRPARRAVRRLGVQPRQ